MSAFFKNEQNLLDVYGLASSNPKGKWTECSTFANLSKPLIGFETDGSKMTTEQAHDILNELGRLEKKKKSGSKTGKGRSTEMNTDSPPFVDIDPLDGNQISNRVPNMSDPLLYSINSTKFNPKLFLQNVHSNDSFEQFTKYLDTLDSDLNYQSSDLKKFVHSNFTRYVRSKNNLDNIYEQFNAGSAQLNGGSASANPQTKTTTREDEKFQSLEKSVLDSSKKGIVLSKKLMMSDDLIKNYVKAISYIENSANLVNLPRKLRALLNNGNYSELLYEYNDAKKTYCSKKPGPNERKIWNEVENVVDQYRQHLWNLLLENDTGSGFIESKYDFLPIISKLLDLDVEDSPICLWIDAKLDQAKNKLKSVSSLMTSKLEEKKLSISLQNLALNSSSSSDPGVLPEKLSYYLQFTTQDSFSETQFVDQTVVVEMWFLIIKYINDVHQLATSFVEFWGNVQNFLNGSFQQTLINDKKRENIIFGNSNTSNGMKFASDLEPYQIGNIIEKGTEFVNDLIILLQNLFEVNSEKPTEFNFLVPGCNNLSCLRYLPMVVEPVFRLCNDIGQLSIDSTVNDSLQKACSQILENSIAAIDYTRLADYKQFDSLETWSIYEFNENVGQTGKCTFLPIIVKNVSIATINTLQNLVFFYEILPVSVTNFTALGKPSAAIIKHLQEEQVKALETVLESLLKDANRKKETPRTMETLLTLNNIQVLAKDAFPFILNYFQTQFDISSKNASAFSNLQMFTILEKMHSSILINYASDLKYELRQTLEKGFTSIDWISYTTTSFRASDYILEVLMILVQVHRDCSNISPNMSQKITSEAQQFISTYLYKLFKEHIDGVSTDGLLQVTLDFEFFIKVLSNILDAESERKLKSCLLYCFHNNPQRLEECVQQIQGAIDSSMNRTAIQFASFRD